MAAALDVFKELRMAGDALEALCQSALQTALLHYGATEEFAKALSASVQPGALPPGVDVVVARRCPGSWRPWRQCARASASPISSPTASSCPR